MSSAHDFLSTLFGDIDDGWIHVFVVYPESDIRKSAFFKTPQEAAAWAVKCSKQGYNSYFGMAVSPKDFSPKRCPEEKTIGIPMLWGDIDFGTDHEGSKNYFPSYKDVIHFLQDALPAVLWPSVIVFSGRGIHAYWIFKELWTFDTDEEREQAKQLCHDLQRTLQKHAQLFGVAIDSTFDLARVLRVPGTHNHNMEAPALVEVLEDNGKRFNPDDIRPLLQEFEQSNTGKGYNKDNKHNLRLSVDNVVPAAVFENMEMANDKFHPTYHRHKNRLKELAKNSPKNDASLSVCDQSLANMLAQAGQPPQVIADVIMSFRKLHGKDKDVKKALRLDYINNTIDLALSGYGNQIASEELKDFQIALNNYNEDPKNSPQPDMRDGFKILTKELFGLDPEKACITEIIKYKQDKSSFVIRFSNDTEVHFESADHLINQAKFRALVAGAIDCIVPRMKTDQWDKYMRLIMQMIKVIDTGAEGYAEQEIREKINEIVFFSAGVTEKWEDAWHTGLPFIRDEKVYVFFDDIYNAFKFDGNYTRSSMAKILTALGCEYVKMNFPVEEDGKKKRIQRRVREVTPVTGINVPVKKVDPSTSKLVFVNYKEKDEEQTDVDEMPVFT